MNMSLVGKSFREKLYLWLEHGEGVIGRLIALTIACLVMISIFSLPFELLSAFKDYHQIIFLSEVVIIVIFTIEYFLRIYSAPKWWKYIFSWYGLIDLIAILPFYIALIDLRVVRFVRLARLARIFKIANINAMRNRAEDHEIMKDEEILHIAQRHPVIFLLNLLPVFLILTTGLTIYIIAPATWSAYVLFVMFLFAFILFIKAWFEYSHNIIYVTNYRIISARRHLFGRETHELYHSNVVDVKTFHPHIFAFLFNYGSIIIETQAGTRAIKLNHISEHEKIRIFIDQHRTAS